MFDCVVAADLDWGIGKADGLPWPRLKGDLAHFKRVTCAAPSAVIMGRKTWLSKEVGGKPLPGRRNIVVTRQATFAVPDGVIVAPSLPAALEAAGDLARFVVGGAALYRVAFAHPELRWIYLTRIAGQFGCDVFIPDLDVAFERDEWDGDLELEDKTVSYTLERLKRRQET